MRTAKSAPPRGYPHYIGWWNTKGAAERNFSVKAHRKNGIKVKIVAETTNAFGKIHKGYAAYSTR